MVVSATVNTVFNKFSSTALLSRKNHMCIAVATLGAGGENLLRDKQTVNTS